MARSNKIRYAGWLFIVITTIALSGCASYKAKMAYEEAEQYAAEENFDVAVEKYAEASEFEPSSMAYKLKLVSSKTRAASLHVKNARQLREEGKYSEALKEYNLAKNFDPSIEVAAQEADELINILEAQKFAQEGAEYYAKRNVLLARKAIKHALKLDANNARALAIKDLLDRDLKTVSMDGIELDIASEEPITLSFKDANIKEVFGILSELSGINFIFDEDIRSQSISVLLEKASFAQAMELIMQMNGLGKKVLNSKTIIIYPQSREKDKQYEDQLIQTFYLSHIDAKKAVNLLRTMLQLRKVYVHEERNALVVRDKPAVIRLAEQILEAADRADSEVLFDVEVLSVREGDKLDVGPQLNEYGTRVGFDEDLSDSIVVQSLNDLQTFYSIPGASFEFAKTLDSTEILASPKIRVKNKEKAKVHIGKRDPIVTTTTVGTNESITQNVQYVDSGIKLDIEPTVQLDGTVLTKIKLEVSSAQRLNDKDDTGTSPVAVTTTNAETSLVLRDGARTILGGLYETVKTDNRTTFPLLGDIPLIGSLFTNFSVVDEKREIILSITPYIIKKTEVPDVDIATIWSGGEDNLKDGPNFGAFVQPLLSDLEATKPLAAPSVKPVAVTQEQVVSEQPTTLASVAAAQAEPVPADVKSEQAELVASSVAETQQVAAAAESQPEVPAAEAVPTEVMVPKEELGPPIVLPLPKKKPAMVSFTGPESAEVGKEFSVAVKVNEVENLYSAPLFVRYDPATLDLVAINEGDFLKQDGETTVFSSSPNRSTGKVIVGYKQGTGGKGATGSGTLFNLVFKPVASGEAKVEASRINFRNPDGVRLEVDSEAVTIEVR